MTLNELKLSIAEIQSRIIMIEEEYYEKVSSLKDEEREIINSYIEKNAKYRMGQKVVHRGRQVYIGWIDVDKQKWQINYKTLGIKVDGTPSSLMSTYLYPEEEFESIKKVK